MNKFRDQVAAYFLARPNAWIDGMALEPIGGKYAWRSRVSDCRTELGMVIRNRQRRQTFDGKRFTTSEYMFVPTPPQAEPPPPHDLNQPWELR